MLAARHDDDDNDKPFNYVTISRSQIFNPLMISTSIDGIGLVCALTRL